MRHGRPDPIPGARNGQDCTLRCVDPVPPRSSYRYLAKPTERLGAHGATKKVFHDKHERYQKVLGRAASTHFAADQARSPMQIWPTVSTFASVATSCHCLQVEWHTVTSRIES